MRDLRDGLGEVIEPYRFQRLKISLREMGLPRKGEDKVRQEDATEIASIIAVSDDVACGPPVVVSEPPIYYVDDATMFSLILLRQGDMFIAPDGRELWFWGSSVDLHKNVMPMFVMDVSVYDELNKRIREADSRARLANPRGAGVTRVGGLG